jgi:RNA polymerase sigma-70 factor (ECF subfamily)
VRRVLRGLPEGPRDALSLFHLEGLSYQEVAARLGVPLGTVATWVTRGRKAMAEALEDDAIREPKQGAVT